MRPEESARSGCKDRPPSSFAALLAASGTLARDQEPTTSQSQPSKQSASSQDAGATNRLSSPQPDPAQPDSRPEGIGDSGDAANSSSASENIQGDGFAQEESSEVNTGPRGGGWEAGSHRRGTKRQRMVWTSELHDRFLKAVQHLGMKNAVPKTILRMMNVDGMTRENVASHLQKYRLHLKRQATTVAESAAPRRPANPAAAPVAGMPVAVMSAAAPASAQPGMALGLPVCEGAAAFSAVPASMAHIPPQAWSAGVPGYDALQVIQNLSGAATTQALPAFPASLAFPAGQPQQEWTPPVLDIAPLSTKPPPSSAATN